MENAETRLIEICMDRKGHHVRYAPAKIPGVIGWVTPSVPFRRRNGYGFGTFRQTAPKEHVPTDEKGRDALAWKYAGNESHVVRTTSPLRTGTIGAEGCIGEARRTLGGTIRRWDTALSLPQDWSAFIGRQIASDPNYLGAPMRRWAACMAKHGYRYRTLNDPYLEAYRAFQAATGPESPPAWERRLAVRDARCQISTHLDSATKRIQDRHLDALPYQDRRHLRYVARVRAEVVAKARRVLAEYPR